MIIKYFIYKRIRKYLAERKKGNKKKEMYPAQKDISIFKRTRGGIL